MTCIHTQSVLVQLNGERSGEMEMSVRLEDVIRRINLFLVGDGACTVAAIFLIDREDIHHQCNTPIKQNQIVAVGLAIKKASQHC